MADAVAKGEPEVIVHQLTALSGPVDLQSVTRMEAAIDRLRTEGTGHPLAAARAVGIRRFVALRNVMWRELTGGSATDESARIEPNPSLALGAVEGSAGLVQPLALLQD
ncbi:hypothetical protein ABT072_07750 [Streptomyces sp. NPDC002589]|uniref:hypothetical protein n=1 Tax=Streptomyces sp. NPDC002589 TaxID=3154420 RepID=UPI003319629A